MCEKPACSPAIALGNQYLCQNDSPAICCPFSSAAAARIFSHSASNYLVFFPLGFFLSPALSQMYTSSLFSVLWGICFDIFDPSGNCYSFICMQGNIAELFPLPTPPFMRSQLGVLLVETFSFVKFKLYKALCQRHLASLFVNALHEVQLLRCILQSVPLSRCFSNWSSPLN